ncbi:unnamed protein product, partial [Ixodes hexagonus]
GGSVDRGLQRGEVDKGPSADKGSKGGEPTRNSVVVRRGRPASAKVPTRKASERARSVPGVRSVSPGVHWLALCRLGAHDQLRQSYGQLEAAWEQTRKLPACPGRERFLLQVRMDAAQPCAFGPRAVDFPSYAGNICTTGALCSYSTVKELQEHKRLMSVTRHILLDRFLTDLCLEHVLPLLSTSSNQAGPDFAAVLRCFFGVVCNGGRHFPAFVKVED